MKQKVKVLFTHSCPALCDPMNCSPPGFSVHGILKARILEWVAMPSSTGSSQPRDQTQVSYIVDSLPSEPPRKSKNTGVGSLFPLQRIFPSQAIKPGSSVLQMDSLPAALPIDKIRKALDVTPEKSWM